MRKLEEFKLNELEGLVVEDQYGYRGTITEVNHSGEFCIEWANGYDYFNFLTDDLSVFTVIENEQAD